ncbi:hypothetical protein M0R45_006409 [Rubus argutus]|uniref:Uncharacterized protein n=1 Tax=Rubus argutus TaxID=59490 RepID=A0AAW1YQG5_RUBAR
MPSQARAQPAQTSPPPLSLSLQQPLRRPTRAMLSVLPAVTTVAHPCSPRPLPALLRRRRRHSTSAGRPQ